MVTSIDAEYSLLFGLAFCGVGIGVGVRRDAKGGLALPRISNRFQRIFLYTTGRHDTCRRTHPTAPKIRPTVPILCPIIFCVNWPMPDDLLRRHRLLRRLLPLK